MGVQRLSVVFESGASYDIRIGQRILVNLGHHLRALEAPSHLVLITDDNVAPLYLETVEKALADSGFRTSSFIVPAGEQSKSLEYAGTVWNALLEAGCDRASGIVALGGGVIGDLAGFVAATYMRGIPLILVPTTLLAMVDASVGGKNALNLPTAKNIVGTFAQPRYVAADIDVLSTLSEEEWHSGLAEVVKAAVLLDDDACVLLADHASELLARDQAFVQEVVVQAVAFKAEVVSHDETEHAGRVCLNYGHTFGHALEEVLGYGTISHGRAVAEGMRFAARLGVELLGTSMDFVLAQDDLLDSLCLTRSAFELDEEALLKAMAHDKKGLDGAVRFVLPIAPGDWRLMEVPQGVLREQLGRWAADTDAP